MSFRDRVAAWIGWQDPYPPSPDAQQSLADLRQRVTTARAATAQLIAEEDELLRQLADLTAWCGADEAARIMWGDQ